MNAVKRMDLICFFFRKYNRIKNNTISVDIIKKKILSKLEYSFIAKVITTKIVKGRMITGKKA